MKILLSPNDVETSIPELQDNNGFVSTATCLSKSGNSLKDVA
jgi:hypothetical protein